MINNLKQNNRIVLNGQKHYKRMMNKYREMLNKYIENKNIHLIMILQTLTIYHKIK